MPLSLRRSAVSAAVLAAGFGLSAASGSGAAGLVSAPGGGASARLAPARALTVAVSVQRASRRAAPRFFVDTILTDEGSSNLQVRRSATGALVAQDDHVASGTNSNPTGVAATGPRSFVIALPARGGCATLLYRLRLGHDGRPGTVARLGHELPGQLWSLTASASGQVIGYVITGCGKGHPGHIGVVSTRTGRGRQWGSVNAAGLSPGRVALQGGVSLSANGRRLAFAADDATAGGVFRRQVVRVLRTGAAPGTAAARSRVVLSRGLSGPQLAGAVLSRSGASVYLCRDSERGAVLRTTIASYRTATGRRRRVVATLRGSGELSGCAMALDTTGRYLLVPYSLRSQHPARGSRLLMARISLRTGAVLRLDIRLPVIGGMDPYSGMSAAW